MRVPVVLPLVVAAVLLAATPAAGRERRVHRPPLPSPVPQVVVGECPGFEGGCYLGRDDTDSTGRVYATGAAFVVTRDRFAILHEFGHAYDATMMDPGERNRFAHLMDMNDLLWTWSYTDEAGHVIQSGSSPAELFADAYANCRMGHIVASGHVWESGYGYYPRPRQHRLICGMIARAGRDLGQPVAADGSR